eukprot:10401833-Ditylum_brightwellii.AAC.1
MAMHKVVPSCSDGMIEGGLVERVLMAIEPEIFKLGARSSSDCSSAMASKSGHRWDMIPGGVDYFVMSTAAILMQYKGS